MNVKDDKTEIPTLWPAVILPSITDVACSRLRDCRARGIEKARTRKKTGGNWGEGEAASLSLPFPFHSPPRPHFRASYTFASSPLSESLEQAITDVDREDG